MPQPFSEMSNLEQFWQEKEPRRNENRLERYSDACTSRHNDVCSSSPYYCAICTKLHQTTKSSVELQEQIRRRPYELYEQRGRDDGHELDDWLQAESEVTQRKAKTVAA